MKTTVTVTIIVMGQMKNAARIAAGINNVK